MSVSNVARRHDINANMVFGWRKQYRVSKLVVPAPDIPPSTPCTELLSVDVIDSALVLLGAGADGDVRTMSSVPMPAPVCEIEAEIGKRRVKIHGLSAERTEAFLQECLT